MLQSIIVAALLYQVGNSAIWVDARGTVVTPAIYEGFTNTYVYFDAAGDVWGLYPPEGILFGDRTFAEATFYFSDYNCVGTSYVWNVAPRFVFQLWTAGDPSRPRYFVLQDNPVAVGDVLVSSQWAWTIGNCINRDTTIYGGLYRADSAHEVTMPAFNFVAPLHIERR